MLKVDKKVFLIMLFTLAIYFVVRITAYPCNPYGDEAWYYYISKTLYWNWDPHLPFLPPIRWAFMIIMHPFTQNIWTFRTAYVLLNSLTIIAIYLATNNLLSATIASLGLALNPLHTFYSVHVFTTTLSATFLVLSLSTNSLILSFVFALLSVGSWEGALFPYLILSLYGIKERKYLIYLVPVALALATSYDNLLFHQRPPGWTNGPLTYDALAQTFLIPVGLLVALYFLLKRDFMSALLAISEGLGLVIINLVKGTMIENWYQLVSQVLITFYLARISYNDINVWELAKKKFEFKRILIISIALLSLISFLYVIYENYRHSIGILYGPKDCCYYTVLDFLKVTKKKVILYDVFWAYQYYPFGEVKKYVCYDVQCLLSHMKLADYVLTPKRLELKDLRLVYHSGECYLYKVVR